jgi:hypothetical protein
MKEWYTVIIVCDALSLPGKLEHRIICRPGTLEDAHREARALLEKPYAEFEDEEGCDYILRHRIRGIKIYPRLLSDMEFKELLEKGHIPVPQGTQVQM